MTKMNISEAKANLSRLIEEARRGGEVIIAKAGKPVVKLVCIEDTLQDRVFDGAWRGKVRIADDFDELPEDMARAFGMID